MAGLLPRLLTVIFAPRPRRWERNKRAWPCMLSLSQSLHPDRTRITCLSFHWQSKSHRCVSLHMEGSAALPSIWKELSYLWVALVTSRGVTLVLRVAVRILSNDMCGAKAWHLLSTPERDDGRWYGCGDDVDHGSRAYPGPLVDKPLSS